MAAESTQSMPTSLAKEPTLAGQGHDGLDEQERMRYKRLLALMQDAYFETNPEGNLTFINQGFCKLVGRNKSFIEGTPLWHYFSPDDPQIITEAIGNIIESHPPGLELACLVNRPCAPPVATRMVFQPIMGQSGQPIGISGVARDISGQKELETALKRSERRYRQLLELTPYAITISRIADQKYVFANQAFYEGSGYCEQEIIGRTTTELSMYADMSDRERLLETLRAKGRVDGMEIAYRMRSGKTMDVLVSVRPITFNGDHCLLFVSTDVSALKAAHRALEDREARYRTILDTAPYSIVINRNSDGTYVEVNEAFCKRSGYSRQEIIGRTPIEMDLYVDPSDRQRLYELLRRNGQVQGFETRFRLKDGAIVESVISSSPIRYGDEDCLLSITVEIAALKEYQRALRESEKSYRTILESAPYSIGVVRLSDSCYLQVNEAFCRRTGYSREEAIGRKPNDLNIIVDPKAWDRMLAVFSRDGRVDSMELQFRSKGGRLLDSLYSMTPITYKGEDCLLVMTVAIGELKEAQQALRESEEKYRNILTNIEEGYWEVDLKGNFLFANEAEGRMHRCSAKDLIGKSNRDFSKPDTSRKVYQVFNRVYQTGIPVRIVDYELQRKDGTTANIELSASLLKDASGKPIGFFGVSRDITEKKRAEKELEKYRHQLEEMVAERTRALETAQAELVKKEKLAVLGQLTATVSHELRNPLGVIRSSNFYLQRRITQRDKKIEKHFRRIEDQVALCDTIVADLLEYTRGRNVSVNVKALNPWVDALLNQEQESTPIAIRRNLSESLPPVAHDLEKMRRVVINLVDNALLAVQDRQAAHKNDEATAYQPMVSVTTKQEDHHVVIQVADNGIGMSEQTRQRAFEPLFTTRARGTGIGLANVRKIILEHNGSIELASEPDQGTTVTIKLPCPPDA